MFSPFGVDHGIVSKSGKVKEKADKRIDSVVDSNGKLSDTVAPIAPGSTVDVYNNSGYNKRRAAAENWGAKIGGGVLGTAAGYGAYRALKGKGVKALKSGKKVSGDKKEGIALAGLTSVGSSIGGYAGGRAHQEHVKRSPKYRYKEK